MRKFIATTLTEYLNEQLLINKDDDVEVYMVGDTNREMFVFIVVNDEAIGGQYSGISPIKNETQFASMKVGISDEYKGKGYGTLLYLTTLSLLENKGLSPHRKEKSTRPDAIKVWSKLTDNKFIKRIELDKKLYDNNEILDSKYIITDKSIIDKYKNVKKISNDAFDTTNEYSKQAWNIVNKHMDNH